MIVNVCFSGVGREEAKDETPLRGLSVKDHSSLSLNSFTLTLQQVEREKDETLAWGKKKRERDRLAECLCLYIKVLQRLSGRDR